MHTSLNCFCLPGHIAKSAHQGLFDLLCGNFPKHVLCPPYPFRGGLSWGVGLACLARKAGCRPGLVPQVLESQSETFGGQLFSQHLESHLSGVGMENVVNMLGEGDDITPKHLQVKAILSVLPCLPFRCAEEERASGPLDALDDLS